MEFRLYDTLPQEAKQIRQTVFVEEQGFMEEFDETDTVASHLVLYDGAVPVATCRFYEDAEMGAYVIGRIAVMKNYRGRGLGSDVIEEAERHVRLIGGKRICLHAQKRVKGFYEGQGYRMWGEEDEDEGCPHIWMEKCL